jgi:hypothetical protein
MRAMVLEAREGVLEAREGVFSGSITENYIFFIKFTIRNSSK